MIIKRIDLRLAALLLSGAVLLGTAEACGVTAASGGSEPAESTGADRKVKVESWTVVPMDGSRVGAQSPSTDNVRECLGEIRHGKYYAPDGKVYGRRSATFKAAEKLLAVQPTMAPVKVIVGYSTSEMEAKAPESALSNWFIDNIMEAVEKESGKKVDFGVGNFGGIRGIMPEGAIILDDLISMFPFKNQIVYLELPGSEIRSILETMAEERFQVLGGCRVVAEKEKLVSAEIGGEPLDDGKWYGVATISFLLDGGDGLYLAKNSRNLKVYEDMDIIDIILAKVKSLTDAGLPVEYHKDGRVKVIKK